MKFSVVIPVFNEEGNLDVLYARLTNVMESLGEAYEIIFIDDGSTDGSFQILSNPHQKDKNVKVIRFTRNFGQHPAITAGFDFAKGETIITIDADLQNPPEEIPKLLEKLSQGYEVVAGYRESRHDSFWRRLSSHFTSWLMFKLTGVKLKDQGCMLRVYQREVIDMLKQCKERTRVIPTLVSWLGVPTADVKVAHNPGLSGSSKYNFPKLLRMYYDLVTGFSDLPIQIVNYIGFLLPFVGFGIGIYLIVWRIVYGPGVSGLISFIALSFFFFGILLIALGLIDNILAGYLLKSKIGPITSSKKCIISKGGLI